MHNIQSDSKSISAELKYAYANDVKIRKYFHIYKTQSSIFAKWIDYCTLINTISSDDLHPIEHTLFCNIFCFNPEAIYIHA